MSHQVLWNLPIAATVVSLSLLIVAAMMRRERLLFIAVTLILINANTSPVVAITSNLGLGLGSAWFLLGGVLLILTISYRLNPTRYLLPRLGLPGVLLFITLCYMLLISPIVTIDRAETVRRSLSFLLVYTLGWGAFGGVFAQRPQLIRARVYTMLYTAGCWNILMLVALLVVVGPSAARGQIGGLVSVPLLVPISVSRLQVPGFLNATGVGMSAASSALLVVHWWQARGGSTITRLLLALVLVTVMVALIWSAGRTAILALVGTIVVVLLLAILAHRGRRRFRTAMLLLLCLLALVPLIDVLAGLFVRGGESSLVEAFWQARLDLALEGVTAYRSRLVWGAGTGVLLSSFTVGDIVVESLFFRVLIELGVIGGGLYLITWMALTYYVIRADLRSMRFEHRGSWLPSSSLIYVWMTSPAAFAFSIFDGGLVIQLAIAAAAAAEWRRIHFERRHNAVVYGVRDRKCHV